MTETHNKTEEGIRTKKAFITEKELREHNGNNGSKSWIAIKDKVYDVTDFGEEHPREGLFSPTQDKKLQMYSMPFIPQQRTNGCRGFTLESSDPSIVEKETQYRRDITGMKSELMKARAFESSKLYYTFKVASNAAILASSFAVVVMVNGFLGAIIGGILLAHFWQQC